MTRFKAFFLALAATWLTLPAAALSIGDTAPDFSLDAIDGKPVKLSQFKGQYVVLEWVNPDCPFVQKHYDSGNMPRLQKDETSRGVAWLTIDSTRQAHPEHELHEPGKALGSWLQSRGTAASAVMLDADGRVARLFGAKTTPHMYVIDPNGRLIYTGAIDSIRSADIADIAKATNYVRVALDEARAGKPVTVASTQSYGCTIKY